MPLPHWVGNALYGPVLTGIDLGEYSEAEDPSDTEPLCIGYPTISRLGRNYDRVYLGIPLAIDAK